MCEEYVKYVKEWTENPSGSPLSYEQWQEETNISDASIREAKETYQKLIALGKEIEQCRLHLYVNKAHKWACYETSFFNELDDFLFKCSGNLEREFSQLSELL